MTLDDTLWDILDTIKLGEFFDRHNIPPVVFPIAIIAIIAVVFFLLLSPGGPSNVCVVDGMCNPPENATNCPQDCNLTVTPTTKTIKVYVRGGGDDCTTLRIVLKQDPGGTQIDTKDVTTWNAQFTSVTAARVYAEVSSPQSTKAAVRSGTIETSQKDTIEITNLPDDYCEAPAPQKGNIKVTVVNSQTGLPVTASVTLFDEGDTPKSTYTVTGEWTFSQFDVGYYYFTASATGYENFYGKANKVLVEAGATKPYTISMVPLPTPTPTTGSLEVCISTGGVETPASGEIAIYDIEGALKYTKSLSECPLMAGTSNKRCATFTLTAGAQYKVGMTRAPSGCSTPALKGPYSITQGQTRSVVLNLTCVAQTIGYIRAIVYGNDSDEVLTDNCTVELYYSNGTKIKTMNISEDDEDYTEWVSLEDDDHVYIYAKNVPTGYIQTKSSTKTIDGGENTTVRIDLDSPEPPMPNLTIEGYNMAVQFAEKGKNFTATATAVKDAATGTVFTPTSGAAAITCKGSWSGAPTVSASYSATTGWLCRVVAPNTLGAYTIAMTATKSGYNPKTVSFSVNVVNQTREGYIAIDEVVGSRDTDASPISIKFNITYSVTGAPVTALYSSTFNVTHKSSGGKVVVTPLTAVAGSPGIYLATAAVPFGSANGGDGVYQYVLNVSAILNNTLQWNRKGPIDFSVITGGSTTITCVSAPQIAAPGGEFNITSTLTFLGQPLEGQTVKLTVTGVGGPTGGGNMGYNSTTKQYRASLLGGAAECKYSIMCYAAADPKVNATAYAYIVNPTAIGANYAECPTLQQPAGTCDSVADAEDCYNYAHVTPGGFSLLTTSIQNAILNCANTGLQSCSGGVATGACYQAVRLKVQATNGTCPLRPWRCTNTTDDLYYLVEGAYGTGKTSTLPYSTSIAGLKKPTLGGTVTYNIIDLHISGGTNEPGVDAADPLTSFSNNVLIVNISSTGVLMAKAYCLLNCGGLGDLDKSGTAVEPTDTDVSIMTTITDEIYLLGKPPYSPWPQSCADVNSDTHITEEDLECIDLMEAGASPSLCTDCSEDSSLEICNDGKDNDCDGQRDSETFNNAAGVFYGSNAAIFTGPQLTDLCDCSSLTPCDMVRKTTITGSIQSEADIQRCLSRSWGTNANTYQWFDYSDWRCDSTRVGKTLRCGNPSREYSCDGSTWRRVGGSDTYPLNVYGSVHYVCDTGADICKAMPGTGSDQCPGPGTYWGYCEHHVCNTTAKQCQAEPGSGTDECSTYWGECAKGDCVNGACVERAMTWAGAQECDASSDCTWNPIGTWAGPAAAVNCSAGTAITNYDCNGLCSTSTSRAYCMTLPPTIRLGTPTYTANTALANCPAGSIATGFYCQGGCDENNMRLRCSPVSNGSVSGTTWTGDLSGQHNCGLKFVTRFDCTGDCHTEKMKVACSTVAQS